VQPEFALTDLGNAERLVARHGNDLRFAAGLGWLVWGGQRWKPDRDGEVMRRAKQTVRAIPVEAEGLDADGRKGVFKWAITSESEPRLRAAVKLAESEAAVVVPVDELDADPWLLNAPNGTVDLRSGELREHRRSDLLTKITGASYQPDAYFELWDDFLKAVTAGNLELAAFLARAIGYSVTGHTGEEVLFFGHGPTATGKSTFFDAVKSALGDYADVADFETFLKRRGDAGIRNDIARLVGARLVVSIEVDEGRQLAEGLLKLVTGGDPVTARFLYRETFEFRPSFKLWMAANERPRVNADDAAMWRRIIQVPFTHTIPESERDDRVKLKLRTNPDAQAAILAWAVQGCLEWQRHGLAVPDCVRSYTAEYRAENDLLADWLTDACLLGPELYAFANELRGSYEKWATEASEKPLAGKAFAARLKTRGCTPAKHGSGRRIWRGIALCDDHVRRNHPSNHAGSAESGVDSETFLQRALHGEVTQTAAESVNPSSQALHDRDTLDTRAPAQTAAAEAPA
jgi:putative DNA primase/helicase